ncbi:hypothetical protein DFJ74DRAFT_364601 [Hyaloraphidium curvatum]|nr:hypothetical protein DFJ74DRAFT_364601 [Hyaloraphidium curvatum]
MASRISRAAMVLATPALLLALLSCPAAAAPAAPHVVFERSCTECTASAFCEFAFPGAPQDHVACITTAPGDAHALYRRYEGEFVSCGSVYCCITDGGRNEPDISDRDGCQAACAARPGCTHFEFGSSGGQFFCGTYTSCTNSGADGGYAVYAQAPAACPALTCGL